MLERLSHKCSISTILLACAIARGEAQAAPATGATQPASSWEPTAEEKKIASGEAHYARGMALYERGDLTGALEEFTSSFRDNPSFEALFNVARVQIDLGRPVDALDTIAKLRREMSSSLSWNGKAVADLEAEVAPLVGSVEVRVEGDVRGARLVVDGSNAWPSPLESPVRLRVGRHEARVEAPGYDAYSFVVDVKSGINPEIRVTLSPSSAADRSASALLGPRLSVRLDAAFALSPSLGGDVGGCEEPCNRALGLGFSASGQVLYRAADRFYVGASLGYMRLVQHTSERMVLFQGGDASILDDGPLATDDILTLQGIPLGLLVEVELPWISRGRLGITLGPALGIISDSRTSVSESGNLKITQQNAERYAFAALHVEPSIRASWTLSRGWKLGARIGAAFFFPATVPKYDTGAASEVRGGSRPIWGNYVNADMLIGSSVFTVTPGITVEHDL